MTLKMLICLDINQLLQRTINAYTVKIMDMTITQSYGTYLVCDTSHIRWKYNTNEQQPYQSITVTWLIIFFKHFQTLPSCYWERTAKGNKRVRRHVDYIHLFLTNFVQIMCLRDMDSYFFTLNSCDFRFYHQYYETYFTAISQIKHRNAEV